jgi:hypothetical protein
MYDCLQAWIIISQSPACQLNPNGSFPVPKSPLQTDKSVSRVIYLKLYSVYGSWLHIRDQEADLMAGLDGKKSDGEGQETRRGDVEKLEN